MRRFERKCVHLDFDARFTGFVRRSESLLNLLYRLNEKKCDRGFSSDNGPKKVRVLNVTKIENTTSMMISGEFIIQSGLCTGKKANFFMCIR